MDTLYEPAVIVGQERAMTKSVRNSIVAGALVAMLLAACATAPQMKSVWKDPAYQGHPHRIVVIGMSKEPLNRRIFEDEFVAQLKSRGADAFASYAMLPDSKQDNQAAIAKMVVEQVPDTVLITRLVSKRSVKTVVPGTVYYRPAYYGTWHDYYRYGYEGVVTPGFVSKSEFALMETNLYDARNDNLVWAASYEVELANMSSKFIRPYIATMVNTLVEQGLLRP
jgi:hypothetical protein